MTTWLGSLRRRYSGLAVAFALLTIGAPYHAGAQARHTAAPSPNDELVRLVQAHIEDSIIIDAIDKARGRYDSSIDAIIRLKALGASDGVLAALRGVTAASAARPSALTAKPGGTEPGIVIPDGTEVRLRLIERVTSATARVGDSVRFEVSQDVTVGDRIVIAAGAPASGTVTVAESKRSFGRRGKLDFTIDSVKTVDDQPVRLRVTRRAQGDSRYLATGALTYFTFVGGAFVTGKDVEVDAGMQYVIYIDGDRRVGGSAAVATR